MKLIMFLCIIATSMLLGCSDDSDSPVDYNTPNDDGSNLVDVNNGSTGNEGSTSTTDEIKAKYSTYLQAVLDADVYESMVEVNTKNVTFMIGDSSLTALDAVSAVEFNTRLGYDFFIDQSEITQAQYFAVMGDSTKLPPSYGKNSVWKSMSQPVGNVSLYNALEFCNKRSELKGLDPVYTIEGTKDEFTVAIDYSKNGYALPTATEWEYVSRYIIDSAGTKDYQNSKYLVSGNNDEPSTDKEIESLNGLYGFFGNVREICLSNLNSYGVDSLYNSGLVQFNSSKDERFTVMGGSYKTGLTRIVTSLRQSVSNYNQIEDVGLRCVIRVGDVAEESILEYFPVFDTTITLDTNVTFDTSIVKIDTIGMELDSSIVYDTLDVGPPLELDTLLKVDTILTLDTLFKVDTIVDVEENEDVKQVR